MFSSLHENKSPCKSDLCGFAKKFCEPITHINTWSHCGLQNWVQSKIETFLFQISRMAKLVLM